MPVIKKITNGASISGAINYASSSHVREETIEWLESSGADPELIELVKASRAVLTAGVNCDPDDAKNQMVETRRYHGHSGYKNQVSRSVWSFSRKEVDPKNPEQLLHALDYVLAVIKRAYPDYESYLALHIDGKSHLCHIHVITNKVNLENGKIMNFAYGQQQELLRSLNDSMCQDFGYSVPEKTSTLSPERYTAKELKSLDEGTYDPRVYIKQRLDDALLDPSVHGLDEVQAKLADPKQNPFVQPSDDGELKPDRLAVEVRANNKGVLTYVIHHLDVESSRKRKPGAPAREWVERVHASTLGSVYSIEDMTTFIEDKVRNSELQRQTERIQAAERVIERTVTDSAAERPAVDSDRGASDDAAVAKSGNADLDFKPSEPTDELTSDEQPDRIDDQQDSHVVTISEILAAGDDQDVADGDRPATQNGRVEAGRDQLTGTADPRQEATGSDDLGTNISDDRREFVQSGSSKASTAGQEGQPNVRVWPASGTDSGRRQGSFTGADKYHRYDEDDDGDAWEQRYAFSEVTGTIRREAHRLTKHVSTSVADTLRGLQARVQAAALAISKFVEARKQRQKEREAKRERQQQEREQVMRPDVTQAEIDIEKQNKSWAVLGDRGMIIRDKYDFIRDAYGQPPVTNDEYQTVYSAHMKWRKAPKPFALTTAPTPLGPMPSEEYGRVVFNHDSLVQQGLATKMPSEEIAKQENQKRRAARLAAQKAFQEALVGPDAMAGGGSTGGQPARVPGAKDTPAKTASPEKSGEHTAPAYHAVKAPEPSAPHDLPGN